MIAKPSAKATRENPWIVTSQPAVARFFQVSPDTVREWRARGMPGERGAYDLSEVLAWLRKTVWTKRAKEAEAPDAAERYREAKARREWLRVQEEEGELVPFAEIKGILMEFGQAIRNSGEVLQRRFGPEAVEIQNDAITEAETVLHDRLRDEEE